MEDYYWTLEDGTGRTYSYSFEPTSTYEIDKHRSLIYEEINPGVKRPGAIVFDVAPDAENFTLHISGSSLAMILDLVTFLSLLGVAVVNLIQILDRQRQPQAPLDEYQSLRRRRERQASDPVIK